MSGVTYMAYAEWFALGFIIGLLVGLFVALSMILHMPILGQYPNVLILSRAQSTISLTSCWNTMVGAHPSFFVIFE